MVGKAALDELVDADQTKACLECGATFNRRRASGELRSPQKWRRATYCSRLCAAQHRGRMKIMPPPGWVEPRREPKPRSGRRRGRPSKTSPWHIDRAQRIGAIMKGRLANKTFRQIAEGLWPPITTQACHQAFWRQMRALNDHSGPVTPALARKALEDRLVRP